MAGTTVLATAGCAQATPQTTEPATSVVEPTTAPSADPRYRLPRDWAQISTTETAEGSVVTIVFSDRGWRAYQRDGDDFSRAAWRAVTRAAPAEASIRSVRQQYDCHVLGAWIADERDWDLESWRPTNPQWRARILSADTPEAVCNW